MNKISSEEPLSLLKALLKKESQNYLALECLEVLTADEILFKTSEKKSKENSKESILLSYQIKAAWEKNSSEKSVSGYDELLKGLSATETKHIKITEITSPKATFFVFSNFEITEFIGIIKSNQTLGDIESKLTKL